MPFFVLPFFRRCPPLLIGLVFVFALCRGLPTAQAQLRLLGAAEPVVSDTVVTPRVRAQLVVHAPHGIAPGQPVQLGLRLEHAPQWHTYWKNAGDSGLPTQLEWQLPPGLQAGPIDWPVPQQIRVGDLLNYGYEGTVLLPVSLDIPPDFAAAADGTLTLDLHASWLVCRVECIPEDGQFQLRLPTEVAHTGWADAFAHARAQAPQALAHAQAQAQVLDGGERVALRVAGLPAAAHGHLLDFFPEDAETFHHAAVLGSDWQQAWDGTEWTADLPLSALRGTTPSTLGLVLGLSAPGQDVAHTPPAQAWRAVATVQGRWQPASTTTVSPALAAALEANQAAAPPAAPTPEGLSRSGLLAVLGGLLGGLLLNLMPCVFPVLAIKLVGLSRHHGDAAARRRHGLAYAAGVVLSFTALGGMLLALRAAGEQLGWGFQLQSPWAVAALALLFTTLGLNLAGLFELGQVIPSRLANLHARHPMADALLSGVLAVAIASPCTAPFMGASLGFALGLASWQALAVFVALGVGMALPYVLVSWLPALARWIPRPGAWMERFRHAMAFPMLATVVWLVWVLGQQAGIDGAAALLGLLLCWAAVLWGARLPGRARWLVVALAVAIGLTLGHSLQRSVAAPPTASTAVGEGWQAWSPEAQAAALAAGRPVLVDYTAAWCVTCQYNKRTTLSNSAVLADLAQRQVVLLRADWTRRDPRITESLRALGRSGVPVYALHAPGRPPQLLSELLSPEVVHQALRAL